MIVMIQTNLYHKGKSCSVLGTIKEKTTAPPTLAGASCCTSKQPSLRATRTSQFNTQQHSLLLEGQSQLQSKMYFTSFLKTRKFIPVQRMTPKYPSKRNMTDPGQWLASIKVTVMVSLPISSKATTWLSPTSKGQIHCLATQNPNKDIVEST